ncbi:RelA/SpoT family protein [Parachitinimonas caeni]|uniref:Bifunctional (P)ppGpp synthetase/guanosine-3',5'-bis(Diphosphate) 3'-pyrophosphohydrolase n=1 Tax=Parachitinimonas caeni TaxID=3031301 RepID=A0ABT7DTG0_9NEIS|nr:bifunctional (p)ppGpp synthetase/guanosine-3',5'-bis(diphosphate) 3'-pyrophosphohydrolase [Parachitinimonas caeni]MDK2123254.1 bifunctional (p)ppGpp synthetase/guanosine-3',5'-bis(diphosphate) 3'-pyrophosphohydrolase [Parachitinimonas caeni]
MELALADVPILAETAPQVVNDANALFRRLGTYLRSEDVLLLIEAFKFGEAAHRGQFRKSGEPYITHPLAVAAILADWHLDAQALAAALLHDVMEDTGVAKIELVEKFGRTIADLVDGLSKLERLEFQSKEEAQAENFRKMLMAMARDVRVILVKLADRLHNMRTLESMREDKQKRIAAETMEIYAPIANRIGLHRVYQELDDLSFKYLHPHRYQVLSKALTKARGNRREMLGKIIDAIKTRLADAGIEASISGREKHLHSIYTKMQDKHLSFSEVLDIYGFRVIVKDVPTCYLTLGVLHGLYKPIGGKFKDYVAIPKPNGYQSLHTALFGPYGTPIEIQIRTQDMHKIAESGVASHWMYKSGDESFGDVHQKTHQWLQSLLEIQSVSGDSIEFLEHIKVDLFPGELYVFTPKGKILTLPHGATVVDFAYAVHTDIGNRCIAAKINYDLMPLRTVLRTGDRVEIITAAHAKPNPSWLNFVTTGKARSHIRHFLKTMRYEEAVALGEKMLNQSVNALASVKQLTAEAWERYFKENAPISRDQVLSDIGLGKRLPVVVAQRLLVLSGALTDESAKPGPIMIRGTEGLAVQFAKCCNPIPGDPIIGVIKKGQGLVVHTHDCPQMTKSGRVDQDKLLDVEWDVSSSKLFDVAIKVLALHERGVLAQIAAAISEAGANIETVRMNDEGFDGSDHYTEVKFTVQVENRLHLAKVKQALRQLPSIVRVTRV